MRKWLKRHLVDFQRKSYAVRSFSHKLKEYGVDGRDVLDCSLGTNPYGCSSNVMRCLHTIDKTLITGYPKFSCSQLRGAIVDYWVDFVKLKEENIFFGLGAMGILESINKMLVDHQSVVLGYSPQFTGYIDEVRACGGRYSHYPLKQESSFKFQVEEFLPMINSCYKTIYIDNPNNPTGQVISLEDVEEIVKRAEVLEVPVILDEAYGEFMEKKISAINLIEQYRNLFVVRSFSKGFGLPGLRIGYGIVSKDMSRYFRKVVLPFPTSSISAFLAREALKDENFIDSCRRKIAKNKKRIINGCKGYYVAETSLETPILTIGCLDKMWTFSTNLLKGV